MAKVRWQQRVSAERPGQAHVFTEYPDGRVRSVCGTVSDPKPEQWRPVASGRLCATCRRKVDPENAPKAPSWRRPE